MEEQIMLNKENRKANTGTKEKEDEGKHFGKAGSKSENAQCKPESKTDTRTARTHDKECSQTSEEDEEECEAS
jgi:hypothetical protein